MRTKLTIDDDMAEIIQRRSRELGKSFTEVANAALRKGLAENLEQTKHNVVVRPHDFGASPGIDFDRLNQLADELEVESFLRKSAHHDSPRH